MYAGRATTLFAAVLALVIGCKSEHVQPPRALVVTPNAKAVEFLQVGEIWQVHYQVEIAYPAESVLKHINDELRQAGWMPLQYDFLNPHLLSSHKEGWGSFIDATTKPNTKVHQWLAQWQDSHGDVVFFALRYRHNVKGPPDLNTLHVFGSHSPKRIADMQLKAVTSPQPSNSTPHTDARGMPSSTSSSGARAGGRER